MVAEVLGVTATDRVVGLSVEPAGAGMAPRVRPSGERPAHGGYAGAIRQLLRCAVALQAEDVLRRIGAVAALGLSPADGLPGRLEQEVRDLAALAALAHLTGAGLPAGMDCGRADPQRPQSVIEGLLASRQALTGILRELLATGDASGLPPWRHVVAEVLARRQAETAALGRVRGPADQSAEVAPVTGTFPDQYFHPDRLC